MQNRVRVIDWDAEQANKPTRAPFLPSAQRKSVFVSYGGHNTLPNTEWPETQT